MHTLCTQYIDGVNQGFFTLPETTLILVLLLFLRLYTFNFLTQVPLEDLHWASQQLMEALHIRERYMRVSHQSFPNITSKFFHKKHPKPQGGDPSSPSSGNASVLHSSDSVTDVSAGGDSNNKAEIRQPYPRARVIKHEDRQSIAGKSQCNISVIEIYIISTAINIPNQCLQVSLYNRIKYYTYTQVPSGV